MDLDLTSDQELLAQTANRHIEASFPLAAVRAHLPGGDPGPGYRRTAAELGWYSMLVPEEVGGGNLSGNGLHDAAVVAYARGALLQPGSFVGTNVTAMALAEHGSGEQRRSVLDELLSGEAAATWACAGTGADGGPGAGVDAWRDGDGWRLGGTKTMVQDADLPVWLLVTATTVDGPAQFVLPPGTEGVTVRRLESLDLTRRWCDVRFDDVAVGAGALVGHPGPATATAVEHQLDAACALTVAESVGAMDHDFGMALQYAKDRTAFGRPIGSFQAVKHALADTSLLLEMSKALADAAVRAVGSGRPDRSHLASMAKAFVGDCGIDLAQSCFQVFGGIGYTWDHDQHLYLRRLTVDAALYGDPAWHRERLCRLSGL